MLRLLRRLLLVTLAVALLVAAWVAFTHQGRVAAKAVLLVPQLVPAIPLKLQERLQPQPQRSEVRYPYDSKEGVADLYTPGRSGQYGAILMFLGANPAGRNDERVVNLGHSLARSGIVVMVPWSESMTQKVISAEDVEGLVAGFQYLRGLSIVDPDRVGMGGFCVGASFVVVAAQDPRIRDHVAFVNSFGGYYDAEDLLKAIATGGSFYEGVREPWVPSEQTRQVLTNSLLKDLRQQERDLLRGVYDQGMSLGTTEPAGLSPGGRAVYRLLRGGVAPGEVEQLLRQLPKETQDALRLISPSTRIGDFKARVLIMHDREDDNVPVEESLRLRDALSGSDLYYTEFAFFQHVDPTRPVGMLALVREAWKLFLHLYNVLIVVA